MTIGDLAKVTGVKVLTIRYYEQVGLMLVPPRTEEAACSDCTAHSF